MEMYDCANIGNDDYVKYPVDGDGKIVAVDTVNNGKKLNFITAANAQARIGRALRKQAEGEVVEETPKQEVVPETKPQPKPELDSEPEDDDGSSDGDDV